MARAFGRLSWPAYWLLVLTGFWNYAADHGQSASSAWNTVFALKMICVLLAGVGTFMHTKASTPKARGVYAGVGTLATMLALVMGIALAG